MVTRAFHITGNNFWGSEPGNVQKVQIYIPKPNQSTSLSEELPSGPAAILTYISVTNISLFIMKP